jgi:arginine/lysine/ornithine decarboxylase
MLKLATDRRRGDAPRLVFAARGVHRAFVNACALLDIEVGWIYPADSRHECDATPRAQEVEAALAAAKTLPQAVYITSPNYLGGVADIRAIAGACQKYGVPLLVDNAHGAYLKFLENDIHPITLGAAMCADSAHKTLPVLTGGAYLHISREWAEFCKGARGALSLFASTSPSYLILSSLDLCNKYLSGDYRERLFACCERVHRTKEELIASGIPVSDSEPLKIVIPAAELGYTGGELADLLRRANIEVEFADNEYLVLMITPENGEKDYEKLISALRTLEEREAKPTGGYIIRTRPEPKTSIRAAMLAPSERIPVTEALGRILADAVISCPPAVPVAVSGERIGEEEIRLFKLHGVEFISVVRR